MNYQPNYPTALQSEFIITNQLYFPQLTDCQAREIRKQCPLMPVKELAYICEGHNYETIREHLPDVYTRFRAGMSLDIGLGHYAMFRMKHE